MPDPTPSQAHVDQLLTNISVAYMQDPMDYVAPNVFPSVPVAKASDKYFTVPKGTFFRDEVEVRPMGGRARIVGLTPSTDTYNCEEEALAAVIDDRERANQTPPFDVERSKVKLLTQQHRLHLEKKWANAYFKTGVWATDLTGQAGASDSTHVQYWDLSTSAPAKDVRKRQRAVLAATGYEPNVLVIGSDVDIALADHPDIITRIQYTKAAIGSQTDDLAELARYFGVKKVIVAKAIQNTANEGATDAMSFVFNSKSVLLAYAADEPSIDTPSAGYQFSWTGLLGAGAAATPAAVSRARLELEHSDWFEVRMATDFKVVASDLGVFVSGAVQ